jgi:TPR repeat protein
MKIKFLSLIAGFGLIACQTANAETYTGHSKINILTKDILDIQDIVKIKKSGNIGIEELIQLGDFYSYNKTYRNTFESFNYYKQAARQGSEYAKMMVGYMTYKGYGTDKNVYQGIHFLENIKKPYDKNAQFLLGKIYLDEQKENKAIEVFKKIKDPQSYTYLTQELIKKRRFEEAIPYLDWLIEEENDTVAKLEKGLIYLDPKFKNEQEAVKLLTSAAKDGNDRAQYKLGYYYHKGTQNTIANIQEAVRWYTISSQNNNSFARQELLKIWNDNLSNDNMYNLNNDPYLLKIVHEEYAKENYK